MNELENLEGVRVLKVLHQKLQVLEEHYNCNVRVVLAGGAARDYKHGVEPRDLDYVFIGADAVDAAALVASLVPGYSVASTHKWYHDGIETRLALVIKLQPNRDWDFANPQAFWVPRNQPKNIDFLVYADALDTAEKVLASHDHSINQYMISIDDFGNPELRYTGELPEGQCIKLRDQHTSAARVQYIRDKCIELGWEYIETD